MKKYIMLVIMFIISICFVCYEDNSNVVESMSNESVYVFYDMSDTVIVSNPDTSDIHIEWWGIGMIYSIIMVSFIIYDKKNIKKYEYVK